MGYYTYKGKQLKHCMCIGPELCNDINCRVRIDYFKARENKEWYMGDIMEMIMSDMEIEERGLDDEKDT